MKKDFMVEMENWEISFKERRKKGICKEILSRKADVITKGVCMREKEKGIKETH